MLFTPVLGGSLTDQSQINTSSDNFTLSNFRKFEILKALPKFNAHCHLGGEFPFDTLLKYANPKQIQALEMMMAEITQGNEYEKAFGIFPLINQVINTHEKLREATYQACERFKQDNNQLVLMRTGLKSLEGKGYEDYLKTVLEGIQQASSESLTVLLMLSVKRSFTVEMARATIDLALQYRQKGVVGIDISDISTEGDINNIMSELQRAKNGGLKIAVHMGESTKERDQVLIRDHLEPDLIDHGVNLCEEVKNWIEEKNIPVTICLTSSIATKMHSPEDLHPWVARYVENNLRISHLGTDDATVFGNISLSKEFFKLCSDLEFEKIVQLANSSFERGKEQFGIKTN